MARNEGDAPTFLGDRNIALLLMGCGIGGIGAAVVQRPASWFHMSPGMTGVLTCGLLGFLLVVLDGNGFRRGLQIMLPIVLIQFVSSALNGVSLFWFFGVEALVFGVIGLAMTAARGGVAS